MPTFEMPDQSFLNTIRKERGEKNADVKESGNFLSPDELEKLMKQKYQDKVIGEGAECIVVPIEGEEKKVAAYTYRELPPYKAKKIFYLQRVFSTLFPHNFPHFFASLGSLQKRGRTTANRRCA